MDFVLVSVVCNNPKDSGLQGWVTTILNGQKVEPNTVEHSQLAPV